MDGEVTKLIVNTRRPGVVDVHLDGAVGLRLLKSIAVTLNIGQKLSAEEIEELKVRNLEEKHYQQAMRLLSRRPRSEEEIRQRLKDKSASEEIMDRVTKRLRNANHLDDLAFAQAWVENRNEFRPRSAWAIRAELKKKGVANATIDQALKDFDDEAAVFRAAAVGARKYRNLDEELFRKRLSGYLARRGFSYHLIIPAVDYEWGKHAGLEEESEDMR